MANPFGREGRTSVSGAGKFSQADALPVGNPFGVPVATGSQKGIAHVLDLEALQAALPVVPVGDVVQIDVNQMVGDLEADIRGQSGVRELIRGLATHFAKSSPNTTAVFLLLGTTGTGKTFSATKTGEWLEAHYPEGGFHSFRIDCNELTSEHEASSIWGSPPGYANHQEATPMQKAVFTYRRTLLIFDEIDKANPALLNKKMMRMLEGHTTFLGGDVHQREADIRKGAIILTSNQSAEAILEEVMSRGIQDQPALVDGVARKHLKSAGVPATILGRITRFIAYFKIRPSVRAEIIALGILRSAKEFDLDVAFIEPEVVLDILNDRGQGELDLGARVERKRIDDALGSLFAEAKRQGATHVRIHARPFRVEPAAEGDAP